MYIYACMCSGREHRSSILNHMIDKIDAVIQPRLQLIIQRIAKPAHWHIQKLCLSLNWGTIVDEHSYLCLEFSRCSRGSNYTLSRSISSLSKQHPIFLVCWENQSCWFLVTKGQRDFQERMHVCTTSGWQSFHGMPLQMCVLLLLHSLDLIAIVSLCSYAFDCMSSLQTIKR